MTPLSIEPGCAGDIGRHYSTRAHVLFPWQDAYRRENAGVFPGKMCSDRRKNRGCGQKKKTEGTSSAIFGVGTWPLLNAANSRVVLTEYEFAAEPTTKIQSSKANSSPERFVFHQKDNSVFSALQCPVHLNRVFKTFLVCFHFKWRIWSVECPKPLENCCVQQSVGSPFLKVPVTSKQAWWRNCNNLTLSPGKPRSQYKAYALKVIWPFIYHMWSP